MLRIVNLSKTYRSVAGEIIALAKANYDFPEGKVTAIVGPSGSGKSTLLNLMAGFDVPTTGEVWLGDKCVSKLPDGKRADLRLNEFGFVFQSYNLISVLSAQQNVAFPMALAKVPLTQRRKKAESILKSFGLEKRLRHLPYKLSGGERQRVSIARSLANDPQVVFADEPTGNLDSKSGHLVINALKEVASKGQTVIVVTHDHKFMTEVDATVEIEDGSLKVR